MPDDLIDLADGRCPCGGKATDYGYCLDCLARHVAEDAAAEQEAEALFDSAYAEHCRGSHIITEDDGEP